MELLSIRLTPKNKDEKGIINAELNYNQPPTEELTINYGRYQTVYSDAFYSFSLLDINANQEDAYSLEEILINEETTSFRYNDKTQSYDFIDDVGEEAQPFANFFGFVSLTVIVKNNERSEYYYSEPLSVLVHKEYQQNDITRMMNYIYQNQDIILPLNDNQFIDTSNQIINMESKLELAKDILNIYKENYGYFKTNSRFKVVVSYHVDDVNKLNVLSDETIEYIATHPEHIEKIFGDKGIKIKGETYLPRKTLIQQNKNTVNIYENQVVVGFLRSIIRELEKMKESAYELLKESKQLINNEIDGYIHSSYHIINRSHGELERNNKTLIDLHKEYIKILMYYQSILPVDRLDFTKAPKPSAVLLSVPQYNMIYQYIQKWFDTAVYNLDREKFILSLKDKAEIYEIYVLLKLISRQFEKGYTLTSKTRYDYKTGKLSLYENTICNNTFVFEKENEKLTLYYQPVIYDGKKFPANGISLLRNNSYSVTDKTNYLKESKSFYYTPDYIIKIETEETEDYYIGDAKYSSLIDVKKNQLMPIAFKYLISVSPRKDEKIKGVYIIFGKIKENNQTEELFNLFGKHNLDKPEVKFIPICPNIST